MNHSNLTVHQKNVSIKIFKALIFYRIISKLIKKENVAFYQTKLATIIPEQESDGAFAIKHFAFTVLNKVISKLRNDCASGYGNIPVKFIKPVAEDITSPTVNIINSSIDKQSIS